MARRFIYIYIYIYIYISGTSSSLARSSLAIRRRFAMHRMTPVKERNAMIPKTTAEICHNCHSHESGISGMSVSMYWSWPGAGLMVEG